MNSWWFLQLLLLGGEVASLSGESSGNRFLIPTWHIQSSSKVMDNLTLLAQPGSNISSWHQVNATRCTLLGCLLKAGVYDDKKLFFSDNLNSFDNNQFSVPWLYRNVFALTPVTGQHYFLETNGITSKADIFLNGQRVTSKAVQTGAYAGHTFEITKLVKQNNALLIQVYPTDQYYDFALGFVDWNPSPPDNGTGVWRDISVKQTGPVALGSLRILTDFELPAGKSSAYVTAKATAQNLEDREVTVTAEMLVVKDSGKTPLKTFQNFKIGPRQSLDLDLQTTLEKPAIWWPKAWGDQPLYSAQLSLSVNNTVSDIAKGNFGIRKVTKELNGHSENMFNVNGYPFQVIGGGYSPDIFLRWDSAKFTTQVQYMLDLGHNTVRLEGKMEHPELYDIADRMGLMIIPGWECCDKWEAWTYNEDLIVKDEWDAVDYQTANVSMRHEAAMLQSHPSVLGFLVGSDFWPDNKATPIYHKAFKDLDWQNPIIASASSRGFPKSLGPSGLKMAGPYDWVPPNYWYDTSSSEDRLGAAFGFGSELGAGVGTPEISSLKKFLTQADMDDLWKNPNKGLYHMSTNVSEFYNRKIYNAGLWKRYGAPTSLDDYLLKAQIMDYEATRAQFEGFSALWNAAQPATGLIYWMLNNAWPSLHWNLFDFYLHPAGSYFGAKLGNRIEHVAYDYVHRDVYLINHSIDRQGLRNVGVEAIGLDGKVILSNKTTAKTDPNTSKRVYKLPTLKTGDVTFLRLVLTNDKNATLSRNVYWLSKTLDILDWQNSEWWYTPVTKYADFTALDKLQTANVSVVASSNHGSSKTRVVLENRSSVPSFFLRLNLVDEAGEDILPVFWSDNYVTLWPREKLELEIRYDGRAAAKVQLSGKNVANAEIQLS